MRLKRLCQRTETGPRQGTLLTPRGGELGTICPAEFQSRYRPTPTVYVLVFPSRFKWKHFLQMACPCLTAVHWVCREQTPCLLSLLVSVEDAPRPDLGYKILDFKPDTGRDAGCPRTGTHIFCMCKGHE